MSQIKNPNSFIMRSKKSLLQRWSECDTPSSEPRFQPSLLAKDLFIFIFLPVIAILLFKMIENSISQPKSRKTSDSKLPKDFKLDGSKSQIVEFKKSGAGMRNIFGKRSPGTLIKLRLLNVIETYSNSPVHAQIIDAGLGSEWLGATIIGEATGDASSERINIIFNFARSRSQLGLAMPIKARALSLNGTLGLEADKKEGFFARSALDSFDSASKTNLNSTNSEGDIKQFLIRALASGLMMESSNKATIEKNKSQVLTLKPGEVFFAELTDFFEGSAK